MISTGVWAALRQKAGPNNAKKNSKSIQEAENDLTDKLFTIAGTPFQYSILRKAQKLKNENYWKFS